MSMQEPTDDQLDGLFRKSTEEYDAPFDPAAWQALKSRLDTHDRLTAWEHMLRWGIPALLLLLLTAGSWNAHRIQAITNQPGNANVAVPGSASQQPVLANGPAETGQPAPVNERIVTTPEPGRSETETGSEKSAGSAAIAGTKPAGTALPVLTDSKLSSTSKAIPMPTAVNDRKLTVFSVTDQMNRPKKSAVSTGMADGTSVKAVVRPSTVALALVPKRNEQARLGVNKRRRPVTENPLASPFPENDYATSPTESFRKQLPTLERTGKPATSESPTSPADVQPDGMKATVLLSFSELTNRPGQWPKPLSFRGRPMEGPVRETTAEQPSLARSASTPNGLSVRFLVSPDLSGIGLREIQRPGTNIGLMLEYRLASRWVIQTGALRSTKVYKAYPSDYEWPGNWTSYVKPLSVDGSCRMVDIPINLRYDVVLRPRTDGRLPDRWFVSGGTTMYYMSQEDYVYSYPAHTYNVPKDWHGKTGWNGFSQLNLSGGFERSFSRRLSWQIEPFVKVPLKGVGFFKIDLLSTGAFFSLRYKL